MREKIKAIALTGPTASGKTALSLAIARALGCEIISLDSMQIYQGMDIGTAKATESERAAIPHHMLDILPPSTPYSAYQYKDAAMAIAEDISSRGKIPLFVGGTGLYLDTLMRRGDSISPASDDAYKNQILEGISCEADKIALHDRLRALDSESADKIHYNNVKRVIRAIEICEKTGLTKTEIDKTAALPNESIDIFHITLDFHSRDLLYARADRRVDEMFEAGLADEVHSLMKSGALVSGGTAAAAIGYKEIIEEINLGNPAESAKEKIKQATRNYAKRQLTWFRHNRDAVRIYVDSECGRIKSADELFSECMTQLKNSNILNK